MTTFILMVVAFAVGILTGRAHEVGKQLRGRASTIPALRDKQYEYAESEGYSRAKLNIPCAMTLEETSLVLHRIEGLAKGMTDNVTEMKRVIASYGTESTRPDERTKAD